MQALVLRVYAMIEFPEIFAQFIFDLIVGFYLFYKA